MHNSPQLRRVLASDTAALWLLGLAFTVLHLIAGTRYGFHRDELLTYSNARDLEWGYVVYPPVTAFLARIELVLFGTSLIGFRFFPAIACGIMTVLTGLMARAMGGGRRAMLVAAFAASIGGAVFFTGSFMSYMSFDLLWWVATAWCVVRLLESNDPLVAWRRRLYRPGTDDQVHHGLFRRAHPCRDAPHPEPPLSSQPLVLVRRGADSAHCLAQPMVAIPAPFRRPCLDAQHPHARYGSGLDRLLLSRSSCGKVLNPATVPLGMVGLWFLFRRPEGKSWRIIGWIFLLTLVRPDGSSRPRLLPGPRIPNAPGRRRCMERIWPARFPSSAMAVADIAYAWWTDSLIGGLASPALILPVAPINSTWWRIQDAVLHQFNMQIGWPELAATVAQVRDSLPAPDRATAGVMAADEGEAGAVNLYGRAYGLPRAISGMNSNWLRGYGDPPPQTVIAVGFKPKEIDQIFASCQVAAQLPNPMALSTTPSATATRYMSAATSASLGRSSGSISSITGRHVPFDARRSPTSRTRSTQVHQVCSQLL